MAKRIAVPWGDRPSQAYVEVEVAGEVLPKDVKDKYVRPMYAFRYQDGYRIASFDDQFNPETLDVKAGTNGTVTLFVSVSYYFEEDVGPPLKSIYMPHKGEFSFDCVWRYDCTATGQLSLFQHALQNEGSTSDVRLDRENPDQNVKPPAGIPSYVMIAPKIENTFSAKGSAVSVGWGGVSVAVPGSTGGGGKAGTSPGIILYLKTPVPPPKPTIFHIPPDEVLDYAVYFDHETDTEPSEQEKAKLSNWLDKVKKEPELVEAFKKKYVRMTVEGHASTPGSYQDNYGYAGKRLNYVWEQVKFKLQVEPEKLPLNRSNEDADPDPKVKPKDRDVAFRKDRRVVLHVDKQEAFQAVEKLAKEKEKAGQP
ncbi:MAG TPA: hypothetical protein VGG61_07785 [Gemmataceae bacterium]|jgi:hypothetical protein